jgi:putative transposase
MMETFKEMVNHCIRIGLENNCTSMKKLSLLSYHTLNDYQIQSKYKLTAMAQAAGRLSQMKKGIKKGRKAKSPYVRKPYLVSWYGFKINGMLLSFPVYREFANILLNNHTAKILSDKTLQPRSFVITPTTLSITVRKNIQEIKPESIIGTDRNLRNITISTPQQSIMYRTNKILSIKENSQFVKASFRRNNRRVKNRFFAKIRARQTRRVNQYLHKIKDIIQKAKESRSAIMLDDIKLCPRCGGQLQEDRPYCRKLWCINCRKSMDRDVVVSMNNTYEWCRFCHPQRLPIGAVKEIMDFFPATNPPMEASWLLRGST